VTIDGSVSAKQGGRRIGTLGPGELFGAGTALAAQSSHFEAEFVEDTCYICWSIADIEKFRESSPALSRKFDDVVNRYLVAQINKLALSVNAV
jgi:CRP-like cAMP-binding protein